MVEFVGGPRSGVEEGSKIKRGVTGRDVGFLSVTARRQLPVEVTQKLVETQLESFHKMRRGMSVTQTSEG